MKAFQLTLIGLGFVLAQMGMAQEVKNPMLGIWESDCIQLTKAERKEIFNWDPFVRYLKLEREFTPDSLKSSVGFYHDSACTKISLRRIEDTHLETIQQDKASWRISFLLKNLKYYPVGSPVGSIKIVKLIESNQLEMETIAMKVKSDEVGTTFDKKSDKKVAEKIILKRRGKVLVASPATNVASASENKDATPVGTWISACVYLAEAGGGVRLERTFKNDGTFEDFTAIYHEYDCTGEAHFNRFVRGEYEWVADTNNSQEGKMAFYPCNARGKRIKGRLGYTVISGEQSKVRLTQSELSSATAGVYIIKNRRKARLYSAEELKLPNVTTRFTRVK